MARPAVDQQQVRADGVLALFLVLDQAGEAAAHHLAHHAVVVAGGQILAPDIELAILRLLEAVGAGHDHAADRIRALDMGVVVDLNPLGPGLQTKGLADLVQDLPLRRTFGQAAAQGFARIGQGVIDQRQFLAAHRADDLDPAVGLHREGFLQQLQLVRADVGQDQARDRLVLVELAQEGCQDLRVGVGLVHAREIGAAAPVLAGAIEEDLDTGLAAVAVQGEDVALGHAVGADGVLH